MTRTIIVLAVVGASIGSAVAQQAYPVPGPLNYLPYYAPQASQPVGRPPLSPYLNLLNGNNPALNYYYGVRPLLPGASNVNPNAGQQNFAPQTPGGFFQPVAPKIDPYPEPSNTRKFTLPPAGGPVSYGNSFGSSRAGVTGGRTGFFSGAGATGGTTTPTAPTAKK